MILLKQSVLCWKAHHSFPSHLVKSSQYPTRPNQPGVSPYTPPHPRHCHKCSLTLMSSYLLFTHSGPHGPACSSLHSCLLILVLLCSLPVIHHEGRDVYLLCSYWILQPGTICRTQPAPNGQCCWSVLLYAAMLGLGTPVLVMNVSLLLNTAPHSKWVNKCL
jgi:hypothetical protein